MYCLIIQAGGRGKRLKTFTTNKPKGLISVNSLPIISHIINKLGSNNKCSKVFIIIDFKEEIFISYLPYLRKIHPNVEIHLSSSKPYKGTAAGLKKVIDLFKINGPILYSWCDLLPNNEPNYYLNLINKVSLECEKISIFFSKNVLCRWSIKKEKENIKLIEDPSDQKGFWVYFISQIKN